jgi:hypothetical protein
LKRQVEGKKVMTAKPTRTGISMIVGGAIGYVAAHYLTGANGASHGLVGLVVGGFTPLLVALIRGDDLGSRKPAERGERSEPPSQRI